MSEVVITDDVVRRFQTRMKMDCTGAWVVPDLRDALDYAFNPPAKGPAIATDEQVQSAKEELARMGVSSARHTARQLARNVAQAVVNASAEPEIVVTDEMVAAGAPLIFGTYPVGGSRITAAEVYRATRKLEPKS